MAETGTQMYVRLVQMCNSVGEDHYERIALADKLLKDRAWVESPDGGGGDENRAIDRLERNCFADIVGVVGLPQLLDLFHNVQDRETWKRAKWNMRQLWSDWNAKQKPKPSKKGPHVQRVRDFTPPMEFGQLTPSAAKNEYARAVKAIESDAEKIARLEAENQSLRDENTRLKGEISRLKRGVTEALKIA